MNTKNYNVFELIIFKYKIGFLQVLTYLSRVKFFLSFVESGLCLWIDTNLYFCYTLVLALIYF